MSVPDFPNNLRAMILPYALLFSLLFTEPVDAQKYLVEEKEIHLDGTSSI